MIPTGKARVAGVIGHPVGHSRSPRLHGFWLDAYGIDGAYIPMDVAPENFEAVLRALPKMGFRGANITVPHKEAAFRLVDELDDDARAIGAVNTIICKDDGRLIGRNTDGYGFIANLRANAATWRAGAGPAVVLGAGGAARGVIHALLAAGVPQVRIANRTAARARAMAEEMGDRVEAIAWDERGAALADAALLVNTTSLGMTGQPPLEIDLSDLAADAVVTDIVYSPLETSLLAAARARGNPVVDGLGMLLHQAVPGFEAWFGVRATVTEELRRFVAADLIA